MEIGTLNQRITFLENRVVTDEIGNHTAVWDEAFSCWAKVTLKASAEHTDAGVTKETQALEFLIRQSRNWMPSVTGNRILFRNVTYNIASVTTGSRRSRGGGRSRSLLGASNSHHGDRGGGNNLQSGMHVEKHP